MPETTTTTAASENLGDRTARGAAWMASAQLVARGIGSIRLIVLAAILPLDQLGLFGIALIAIQFIEIASQTGFRQALIQRDGDVSEYLGTAWTVQFVRGILLAGVVYLSADGLERFFEKPGLSELIRLLAVVPLLQGFHNVGMYHLHRDLQFRNVVLLDTSVVIVDFAISVGLAFLWPSAVALVLARIGAGVVQLTGSFIVESRRAPVRFSLEQFRELYSFGFWIVVSAIVSFTLVRGGDLVIGKLLPESELAVYQIAYGLACVPLMQIVSVISTTTYSAYSRMQADPDRLARAFTRVLWLCACVAAYSVAGFAVASDDFVEIFFREELRSVAVMLPLLAVWGACRALGATNSVLFQALGKPSLATIFQFFMLALFAFVLVPFAMRWGTMGVAYALAIIGISAQLLRYSVVLYTAKVTARQIVVRVGLPIAIGIVAFLVANLGRSVLPADLYWGRLVVGVALVSVSFWMCTVYVDARLQLGLTDFVANKSPRVAKFFAFALPGTSP